MLRQYGYAFNLGPSKFLKSLGLWSLWWTAWTTNHLSKNQTATNFYTCTPNIHYYMDLSFWPKSTFGLCSAPTLLVWCDSCEAVSQRKAFMKGSTTSRHRGTVLAHKVSQLVTYKSEFLVVFVFRLRAVNAVPVSFWHVCHSMCS